MPVPLQGLNLFGQS